MEVLLVALVISLLLCSYLFYELNKCRNNIDELKERLKHTENKARVYLQTINSLKKENATLNESIKAYRIKFKKISEMFK